MKKADVIRWILAVTLCYFISRETGVATTIFAVLMFINQEALTFLERAKQKRSNNLADLFNGNH